MSKSIVRGSELTRELLKSQKYVLCKVSRYSDERARTFKDVRTIYSTFNGGFMCEDGDLVEYAVPIDMNGNELMERVMSFTKRFSLENVPDRFKMRLFDKKRCKHFYDFGVKYNKPESGLDLDREDYITIETDDLELKDSEATDLVLQRSTGVYDNVGNLLFEGDCVHLFGYGKYHIKHPYKELSEYGVLTKATDNNHLKKFAEVIKPLKWYDINVEDLLAEATTAISEYSLKVVIKEASVISIQKYDRVTETSSTLELCESLSQAKDFCWWDYVSDMSEYLIEPQPPQTHKEVADEYIRKGGWADASWGLWEKKD